MDTIEMKPLNSLYSSGRNRSIVSTTSSPTEMMISGRIACRSTLGAAPALTCARSPSISGEQLGQAADGLVGDVEHHPRVHAQREDEHEQRRPRDVLHRAHVVDVGIRRP